MAASDSINDRLSRAALTRRSLLGQAAAAIGALLGTAVTVPLIGAAIAPATRRDETQWVSVGSLSDFTVGRPRLANFSITKADGHVRTTVARSVWVRRTDEAQVQVFNARCTHLGCLVNASADLTTFGCPCHGGVFSAGDGQVLDGPPPRPLDRLEYRVDNGQLVVHYQDFRVGIPEKVAL